MQEETKESSSHVETKDSTFQIGLPGSIPKREINVVVCGGGNGAHVMATLASSRPHTRVSVLSLYKDEYSRWKKNVTARNDIGEPVVANLAEVTNDPAKVIPGATVIIFVVPAFAHEQYVRAIKPFLVDAPGCIVGAMPGAGGFDLMCRSVLGNLAVDSMTLFTLETLPWACRLETYGEVVEVLGTKKEADFAVSPPDRTAHVQDILQYLLGELPKLQIAGSLLAPQLMAINSVLHPTMTYGAYRNWDGVTPFEKEILFYEGADAWTGEKLNQVSANVRAICDAIQKEFPKVDLSGVHTIKEWYLKSYNNDIADKSQLHRMLNTNKGYKGLKHPMIPVDGGFLPDWGNRYLSEDIPYGLVLIRGVAEIFDVATPAIDEVLLWGQQKLGKEYLVDGKLCGKDINSTRAPQAYGEFDKETFIRLHKYEGETN